MSNGEPATDPVTRSLDPAPTGRIYNNVWVWAGIALIWGISWLFLWGSAEWGWDWVYEPALVAISLGSIALIVFAAIYVREETEKMKGAIAATFIVVFLLLAIDLLTIKPFRDSLSDVSDVEVVATGTETSSTGASAEPCPSPSPVVEGTEETAVECVPAPAVAVSFVDGLFGVFKWGITAIIIFYFGVGTAADAVKTAAKEKTERAQIAADAGGDQPSTL